MGKIMAIDPGMKLGFAIKEDNKLLTYGTIYAKDYETIAKKIKTLLTNYQINEIMIEDFRFYSKAYKDMHKTPITIGIVIGTFKAINENGLITFVKNNTWTSIFKKINTEDLGKEWQEGLTKGSEHSRDAVAMLLAYNYMGVKDE